MFWLKQAEIFKKESDREGERKGWKGRYVIGIFNILISFICIWTFPYKFSAAEKCLNCAIAVIGDVVCIISYLRVRYSYLYYGHPPFFYRFLFLHKTKLANNTMYRWQWENTLLCTVRNFKCEILVFVSETSREASHLAYYLLRNTMHIFNGSVSIRYVLCNFKYDCGQKLHNCMKTRLRIVSRS